jgi:tripartite-type tricarboxylate transporter receptor subunit TctC
MRIGVWSYAGFPGGARCLQEPVQIIIAQPDTRKRLVDQGFQLYIMPADKATAFVRAERARWAKVAKEIGIEPQ